MSALLVLIGGRSPDAPLAWRRIARDGAVVDRGVLGQGETPHAAPVDTVLVLPGSDAQVKVLEQPASSDAQARAAATYLFRGALAMEAGDVVFAIGARGEGDRRLVAAFDGKRIAQWVARCSAAGLRPALIHLDCTLWPTPDRVVRIVQFGDRTIVAGGTFGGFTLETDLASTLIGPWLKHLSPLPERLEVNGFDAAALRASFPGPIADLPAEDPADSLARAAGSYPAYAPVLRLAEYEGSGRKSSATLRAWVLTGVLAAAAVLIQAGLATFDGLQDAEAARRAMASAESQFRQLRPGVTRIVNLRAQVSAALNAAQPPRANPVLSAARSLATILQGHPDVRLDELRFEATSKRVSLRLSGLQPAPLDAAVADLRTRSPGLEIGQQATAEGRVSINLTVEAS